MNLVFGVLAWLSSLSAPVALQPEPLDVVPPACQEQQEQEQEQEEPSSSLWDTFSERTSRPQISNGF